MVIFTESNLKNLFLEKVTKKLFLLIDYKLLSISYKLFHTSFNSF